MYFYAFHCTFHTENSPVSGLMLFTGESCFTYFFISVLFLITSALLFLPALSVPPQYL